MKPFAIVFGGAGRGFGGKMVGANIANVQCKTIQKYYNESSLYN
jgi:hypothetical protein